MEIGVLMPSQPCNVMLKSICKVLTFNVSLKHDGYIRAKMVKRSCNE